MSDSKTGGKAKPMGSVVAEPRFARMHTDRRFTKMPKQQKKVKLDPRFKAVVEDPRFSVVSDKDKYGRERQEKARTDDLKKFYDFEEDDEAKEQPEGVVEDNASVSDEIADVAEDGNEDLDESEQEEVDSEEFDSDDSEDEEEDEEDTTLQDFYEKEGAMAPRGDESKRLAIVNVDWQRLKAADLYQVLSSFVPSAGVVLDVVVYLSDFGKEMLDKENREGPGVWRDAANQEEDEEDDEKDEDSEDIYTEDVANVGAGIDEKKLRLYELNKLKYYFAVANTDSVATATAIYKALDGHEIERTGNRLDLRFIPDDVSFEGREIRDQCKARSSAYVPPKFETKILEHTKQTLTWDETPPERIAVTQQKFSKDQLKEMDFQAYLASDSDSSNDSDDEKVVQKINAKKSGEKLKQKKRAKYATLLQEINGEEEEAQGDMEVTFAGDADLEKNAEKLVTKKLVGTPEKKTVFDQYIEKRQQKKREKKLAKKGLADGDDEADGMDVDGNMGGDDKDIWADFDKGFEDTTKDSKKKRKRNKKDKNAPVEENPELALLVDSGKPHYDSDEGDRKKEKAVDAKLRTSRQEKILADPRFSALVSDSRFNPDPTNPSFSKIAGADLIVKERQKHQAKRFEAKASAKNGSAQDGGRDMASLVASVKNKVATHVPVQPTKPAGQKPQNKKRKLN